MASRHFYELYLLDVDFNTIFRIIFPFLTMCIANVCVIYNYMEV